MVSILWNCSTDVELRVVSLPLCPSSGTRKEDGRKSSLAAIFCRSLFLYTDISHCVLHSLWSPVNIKGANKDIKINVWRSTTVRNLLLCTHTLDMNYVTKTFLLVSSSARRKQLLCSVHSQGQKKTDKNIQQRNLLSQPFPCINYGS